MSYPGFDLISSSTFVVLSFLLVDVVAVVGGGGDGVGVVVVFVIRYRFHVIAAAVTAVVGESSVAVVFFA